MIKVLGINGSARKDGNTAFLIRTVFSELEKQGIDTELIQLSGQKIRGCTACYKCFDNQNKRCIIDNDVINGIIEKMLAADAIILGSPTYFANMSPEMKCIIDRTGMVARANGDMFKLKLGASVVAVRRGGADHVFNSINQFFFIGQMIVPGSSYWNMAFGRNPGEVEKDLEGMQTMINLGKNMAWLLNKINAGA